MPTASSLTHRDGYAGSKPISWTFSTNKTYGISLTGDYCVEGATTITNKTPTPTSSAHGGNIHGSAKNLSASKAVLVGDTRAMKQPLWAWILNPSIYWTTGTLNPGDTLLSVYSKSDAEYVPGTTTDAKPRAHSMAVLSCLSAIPTDPNGFFRPSYWYYAGGQQQFTYADIDQNRLNLLRQTTATASNTPNLASMVATYRDDQLWRTAYDIYMQPCCSESPLYGSNPGYYQQGGKYYARLAAVQCLKFDPSDTTNIAYQNQLLYYLLQEGIDYYYAWRQKREYLNYGYLDLRYGNTGHNRSHAKSLILMAGYLLNQQTWLNQVAADSAIQKRPSQTQGIYDDQSGGSPTTTSYNNVHSGFYEDVAYFWANPATNSDIFPTEWATTQSSWPYNEGGVYNTYNQSAHQDAQGRLPEWFFIGPSNGTDTYNDIVQGSLNGGFASSNGTQGVPIWEGYSNPPAAHTPYIPTAAATFTRWSQLGYRRGEGHMEHLGLYCVLYRFGTAFKNSYAQTGVSPWIDYMIRHADVDRNLTPYGGLPAQGYPDSWVMSLWDSRDGGGGDPDPPPPPPTQVDTHVFRNMALAATDRTTGFTQDRWAYVDNIGCAYVMTSKVSAGRNSGLTGTGYMEIRGVGVPIQTKNFSASCWVRYSGTITSWARVWDLSTSPSDADITAILQVAHNPGSTGPQYFNFRLRTNGTTGWKTDGIFGTTAVVANTWYYVTCTYNGTTMKLFVNDALDVVSFPKVGEMVSTTGVMRLNRQGLNTGSTSTGIEYSDLVFRKYGITEDEHKTNYRIYNNPTGFISSVGPVEVLSESDNDSIIPTTSSETQVFSQDLIKLQPETLAAPSPPEDPDQYGTAEVFSDVQILSLDTILPQVHDREVDPIYQGGSRVGRADLGSEDTIGQENSGDFSVVYAPQMTTTDVISVTFKSSSASFPTNTILQILDDVVPDVFTSSSVYSDAVLTTEDQINPNFIPTNPDRFIGLPEVTTLPKIVSVSVTFSGRGRLGVLTDQQIALQQRGAALFNQMRDIFRMIRGGRRRSRRRRSRRR